MRRVPLYIWRLAYAACVKNLSHIAAGVAFYMLFSIFPAIAVVISVAGLIADPTQVASLVSALETLLPPDVFALVDAQVQNTVSAGSLALGSTAAVSFGLSFWAAGAAVRGVMTAIHIAFPESASASVVLYYVWSMVYTVLVIAIATTVVLVLVAAPIAVQTLIVMAERLGGHVTIDPAVVAVLGWPILFMIGVALLTAIYRAGAARGKRRWLAAFVSAVVATVLWIGASKLLTVYVTEFGDLAKTYGPLGAVAALMLWFWITALILLLGAELASMISMGRAYERTYSGAAPRPSLEDGATADPGGCAACSGSSADGPGDVRPAAGKSSGVTSGSPAASAPA